MAAVSEPSSSNRFFCHQCNVEIPRVLPDFKCPRCNTGFIEEMVSQPQHSFSDESSDEGDVEMVSIGLGDFLTQSLFSNLRSSSQSAPEYPSGSDGSSAHPGSSSGTGTRRRRFEVASIPPVRATRRRTSSDNRHIIPLENIIHEFIINLSGDVDPAMLQAQGSPMFMYGNPGDYAFGRAGLDAIITQILNQMDGTGPPPMAKDRIAEIPTVNIQQAQVDKNIQCSVCWDDFTLGEPVRKLVCEHLYHEQCIVPWLQLHGTCPICRKSLNDESDLESGNSASAGPSTSARTSESSLSSGTENASNNATSWHSAPGFLSSVITSITNALNGVGSSSRNQQPSSSQEGDSANSQPSASWRHPYNLRSRERSAGQESPNNDENTRTSSGTNQRSRTQDHSSYNFEDEYD